VEGEEGGKGGEYLETRRERSAPQRGTNKNCELTGEACTIRGGGWENKVMEWGGVLWPPIGEMYGTGEGPLSREEKGGYDT